MIKKKILKKILYTMYIGKYNFIKLGKNVTKYPNLFY